MRDVLTAGASAPLETTSSTLDVLRDHRWGDCDLDPPWEGDDLEWLNSQLSRIESSYDYDYVRASLEVQARFREEAHRELLQQKMREAQTQAPRGEQISCPSQVAPAAPSEASRREHVLSFARTPVPAGGASVSVSVEPQVAFTPERLILPEVIAAFITVDGVSLDGSPLFPDCGPMPGLLFSDASAGLRLGSPSLRVGARITVTVTNISGRECIFQAALVGKALIPSPISSPVFGRPS